MMLWIAIAAMAGVAAAAVAWPFLKPAGARPQGRPSVIYKAQLEELARERQAGLIEPQAAEEVRREIARRLLAAEAQDAPSAADARAGRGLLAVNAGVLTAGLAVGLYLVFGAPEQKSEPLAGRDLLAEAEGKSCDEQMMFFRLRLMPDLERPEAWVRERPEEWARLAGAAGCAGEFAMAAAARQMQAAIEGDAADASVLASASVSLFARDNAELGQAGQQLLALARAKDATNQWVRWLDAFALSGADPAAADTAFLAILDEPPRAHDESFFPAAALQKVAGLSCAGRGAFYRLYVITDPATPERWKADPAGWQGLGRANLCLGDFAGAAAALRAALQLLGERAGAENFADAGVAITQAAGGTVTPEAETYFREALARDPESVAARFYLAVVMDQAGDRAGAVAAYQALLATLPPESPWRAVVEARIASAPAAPRVDTERNPEILAMVEGLAARLKDNPRDLDGWLLLLTSYQRLARMTDASAALATAREAFAGDEAALAALSAKAKELGIE
jgi:cytochrome c-type biogenesis protein CcmI